MNISRTFTAALVLMATVQPVQAGTTTISTGGVFGGPNQHTAYCYVFNASSAETFFNIDRAEIIKQDGTVVTILGACNPIKGPESTRLYALQTCGLSAELESGSTYGCRITVSGDQGVKRSVRGTMDIRDAEDNVLTSSLLR